MRNNQWNNKRREEEKKNREKKMAFCALKKMKEKEMMEEEKKEKKKMQRKKEMDFPRKLNIITGFLALGCKPPNESIEDMVKEVSESMQSMYLEDLSRCPTDECWWRSDLGDQATLVLDGSGSPCRSKGRITPY